MVRGGGGGVGSGEGVGVGLCGGGGRMRDGNGEGGVYTCTRYILFLRSLWVGGVRMLDQ